MKHRVVTSILTGTLIAMTMAACASSGGPCPTVTVNVTVTAEPEAPEPQPDAVSVDDVEITLEVIEKQCFGSAGCNVTVEPVLSSLTEAALAGGYRIIYEISGDESGPIVETITVNTDGTYSYDTTRMSTASTSVVPTATVTSVRAN